MLWINRPKQCTLKVKIEDLGALNTLHIHNEFKASLPWHAGLNFLLPDTATTSLLHIPFFFFFNLSTFTTDRCAPICLFHSHTKISTHLSAESSGEVHGPLGTNSTAALRGKRMGWWGCGCRPFREPQKNSVWNRDPPTDRDNTQLWDHWQAALSVFSKPFSVSSNPFLFVVNLSDFLSSWIYSLKVATKTSRDRCFSSWWCICRQMCCSSIDDCWVVMTKD